MGFQLQISIILLMFWLGSLGKLSHAQSQIKVGFYKGKCGATDVEKTVFETLKKYMSNDSTVAPRMLRLFFHDCFVRGCDASVLLEGLKAEKTSIPNLSLKDAFPVIEDAKKQLEGACPGVVSCADILALAARDSVVLTQKQNLLFGSIKTMPITWQVLTGRRDGILSSANDTANLPAPSDNVTVQIQKFSDKGLSVLDLVTLVGAHTIGATQCLFITNRLYNYKGSGNPDPSINTTYLKTLQDLCPQSGKNDTVRVPLDPDSDTLFDNMYYMNIRAGRAALESDQVLLADIRTSRLVQRYYVFGGLLNGLDFKTQFGTSMINMGNIELLTGTAGEIRKVCSATNT